MIVLVLYYSIKSVNTDNTNADNDSLIDYYRMNNCWLIKLVLVINSSKDNN